MEGGSFWFGFRQKETIEGRGTESDSENLSSQKEKINLLKRALTRLGANQGAFHETRGRHIWHLFLVPIFVSFTTHDIGEALAPPPSPS